MTSFFDQWKQQRINPAHLSRESLDHLNRFDRQDADEMAQQIKDYRKGRDDLENVIDTGRVLFDDALHSFHKVDPKLKDPGEMRPSHLVNHAVVDELMKLPEYERLRMWTEGDLVAAAMATVSIEPELEHLADRLKKAQEEAAALQKQMEEYFQAEQGKRDLDEMIEQWKDQPDFDEAQMRQLQQQIQDSLDQMMKDMESQAQSVDQAAQQGIRAGAASLRSAMNQAAQEQDETNTTLQGWGVERGSLQKMDPDRRLELASKLNTAKFKRMAEIWGPMQRIANTEQTRKIYHSLEEIYDTGIGDDLARVLPSEFVSLRHPLLKLDFYRKYTEKSLSQYLLQGVENVGKGGIIVVKDSSGSMGGDPDIWATSIGLCSMNIAKDQKRSFVGITFASAGEMKVWDFRDVTKVTIDDVMDYASFYFGGGTNFDVPLSTAMKFIEEEFDEKGHTNSDIVFITDGVCNVSDAWLADFLEKKEKFGTRCHGIMIGVSSDMEPFRSICDTAVTVKDILTGNDVRTLFRDL